MDRQKSSGLLAKVGERIRIIGENVFYGFLDIVFPQQDIVIMPHRTPYERSCMERENYRKSLIDRGVEPDKATAAAHKQVPLVYNS